MDLFQNKIYQEAARKVKFRIEEASRLKLEVFGQTWYSKHFVVGAVPHTIGDFKTILGNLHMDIAASTIDGKSAEPLRAFEGWTEINQSMFTHAHAYRMEADDIRDMIMMIELANSGRANNPVEVVDYIANKIFDVTSKAVQGVRSRLDIIILEALSNDGSFTFSSNNDPQSPYIGKTVNFGMPNYNLFKVGSGNEWTDAHKSTVDPIKEIVDVADASEVGIVKVLMNKDSMRYILSCSAVKTAINSNEYPNKPVSLERLNAFMEENGYPVIEVVNRKCLIQDGDKLKPYTPWKAGKLVFLPQDQIGTIETRLSDAEIGMASEGVDYTYFGRIEVRKYTQGERENSDYTEITKAAVTAAPAFDTIDHILTLDTLQ